MINIVSVKTFRSTSVNSIAFMSDPIQKHMHSNQRDMEERYKNLRGQRAGSEAETRLNTKIKTIIMYILYINVYLEPKTAICDMIYLWNDILGIEIYQCIHIAHIFIST